VVGGSKVARLLQTGNIGFYIFAMVVSIVLILVANGFLG
jgi:NADH-quinone oxidoreductase subunit L